MTTGTTNAAPKQRDKLTIIAENSEICKKDAPETQIITQGNLSFAQLTHYLKLLAQLDLLENHEKNRGGKKVYHLSKKRSALGKKARNQGFTKRSMCRGKRLETFPL
ncbi:MAG: hypothetical protein NWF00_12890 [Candidatus Bathyarchaeota archaeon]|nr:hypothetical protein [Candidatus Bathyarchaeota archaeon]